MNDPHVERLHYEVGTGPGISFGNPPPLSFTNHLGHFDVQHAKLVVDVSGHYQDAIEAKAVIDPFLRAWEIQSDLASNPGALRFTFGHADVIDRQPPPPGTGVVLEAGVGELVFVGYAPTVHITQNSYPKPPQSFSTTSDVEFAYNRWLGFRAGREPLQAMAYAVLTLIEATAGSRKQAAQTFQIASEVLGTIGRLSSTKGDSADVRKVKPGTALEPLSGGESSWLDQAIRSLIRRLGEHASGATLTQLTMSDLPPL
jgi:hypothetical protein